MLSLLNHTDGYPVTWVVKVGQMGEIIISFQELLAEKRKAGRGKQTLILLNKKMKVNSESFMETHNVRISQ